MKDQMKKRLLDLAFVVLAAFVGLGGFYVYASVKAHQALDAAILDIIRQSQPAIQAPVDTRAPFDQELP